VDNRFESDLGIFWEHWSASVSMAMGVVVVDCVDVLVIGLDCCLWSGLLWLGSRLVFVGVSVDDGDVDVVVVVVRLGVFVVVGVISLGFSVVIVVCSFSWLGVMVVSCSSLEFVILVVASVVLVISLNVGLFFLWLLRWDSECLRVTLELT